MKIYVDTLSWGAYDVRVAWDSHAISKMFNSIVEGMAWAGDQAKLVVYKQPRSVELSYETATRPAKWVKLTTNSGGLYHVIVVHPDIGESDKPFHNVEFAMSYMAEQMGWPTHFHEGRVALGEEDRDEEELAARRFTANVFEDADADDYCACGHRRLRHMTGKGEMDSCDVPDCPCVAFSQNAVWLYLGTCPSAMVNNRTMAASSNYDLLPRVAMAAGWQCRIATEERMVEVRL